MRLMEISRLVFLKEIPWFVSEWGTLLDVFRTKILEINNHSVINNIQQIFQNNDIQLSYT